jgi:hypothetical protein
LPGVGTDTQRLRVTSQASSHYTNTEKSRIKFICWQFVVNITISSEHLNLYTRVYYIYFTNY